MAVFNISDCLIDQPASSSRCSVVNQLLRSIREDNYVSEENPCKLIMEYISSLVFRQVFLIFDSYYYYIMGFIWFPEGESQQVYLFCINRGSGSKLLESHLQYYCQAFQSMYEQVVVIEFVKADSCEFSTRVQGNFDERKSSFSVEGTKESCSVN